MSVRVILDKVPQIQLIALRTPIISWNDQFSAE